MSASSSIATSQSAPLLSGERLRAGLEACGYRCTSASLSGVRSIAPGCTMSLQFGDRVGKEADDVTCLTVRCSIQINGGGEQIGEATRWRIRKEVPAPGAVPGLHFAIEADLIIGHDISLAEVLAHGGDVYRHLHMLIGDASATLYDLSINDGRGFDAGALVVAPVMRIEARFVGDLAAGRSGLVASDGAGDFTHSASVAARHLRITRVACDWLKDDVLPDLASAIRRIVLQVQTTSRYRPSTNPTTEQRSDVRPQPESWAHDQANPSTAIQNENNAAALVSEQVR